VFDAGFGERFIIRIATLLEDMAPGRPPSSLVGAIYELETGHVRFLD